MKKLKLELLGGAATAALLGSVLPTAPASAAPDELYAGGASFPSKVYRDIMNCYGTSDGGNLAVSLPATATCGTATPVNASVILYYVSTGSGAGLKSFSTGDPTRFTGGASTPVVGSSFNVYYGTGVGSNYVGGQTNGPYPKISFIGSDDPITGVVGIGPSGASTLDVYNCVNSGKGIDCTVTAGTTARGWGPAIQIPGLIGAVAIPYNRSIGGWNEQGSIPLGGGNPNSKLDLDTNTWCGIFTGAITDWNDPAITGTVKPFSGNHHISITGGVSTPITVVFRSDGSGTTFLFANALLHQCGTASAPVTGITHSVPDSWANSGGNKTEGLGTGISNNNWFLNLGPGHANILPSTFIGASKSSGMQTTINTKPGSIGYVSPDFVNLGTPGQNDPAGPPAANLQIFANVGVTGNHKYRAPTAINAQKIMLYSAFEPDTRLKPPSFLPTCGTLPEGCAANAADWGKTNPAPKHPAAYPIGGFTFMDLYTCYHSSTDASNLNRSAPAPMGYLRWYYDLGSTQVKTALNAAGFSNVPGGYAAAIRKLITINKPTRIGIPGQSNTGCATVNPSLPGA